MNLVSPLGPFVLLIMRIQTLIEHARLTSTDAYVPWDVWGRDTVIVGGVPMLSGAHSGLCPLVQGVYVIVVGTDDTPDANASHPHLILRTFDLSRWGRSVLGGGRAELKVLVEDGGQLSLPGVEGLIQRGFDSLGNRKFMYMVRYFRFWRICGGLMLWEELLSWSRGCIARLGVDLSSSNVQLEVVDGPLVLLML